MLSPKEYQKEAADMAGMTLAHDGVNLIGTNKQWGRYTRYLAFYEEHGRFPNDKDGMKEMAPNVYIL